MSRQSKMRNIKCVVPKCNGKNTDCFPMNDQNQLLWLYKINNNDNWVTSKMNETQYICSSHFTPEDLKAGYEHIPKNTLPTLNICKARVQRSTTTVQRSTTRVQAVPSTSKEQVTPRKEIRIIIYPMCCACLKNDVCVAISKKLNVAPLVLDFIEETTGIKVSTSKLPLHICIPCLKELRTICKFKEKMARSCGILKDLYQKKILLCEQQGQTEKNNEESRSLNDQENVSEIIDVDSYQESTPTATTPTTGENASAQVRNEISKQISNIVDDLILPKIRELGCDIPPHYKAENRVALFRALLNYSGNKDKCTTSTQTIDLNIPKTTSNAENVESVIVLNGDGVGSTDSALTIPPTSSGIQLAKKSNAFSIVYPTSSFNSTSKPTLTQTSTVIRKRVVDTQIADTNIPLKKQRLQEMKLPVPTPKLPQPYPESDAQKNKILANNSKKPPAPSTSAITLTTNTSNSALTDLLSLQLTTINEQPTMNQPAFLPNVKKGAFPSTSSTLSTLPLPVINQTLNQSATVKKKKDVKIIKHNTNNAIETSQTSTHNFNTNLQGYKAVAHSCVESGQEINHNMNGSYVMPHITNPIGISTNSQPPPLLLPSSANNISAYNGINFLVKPQNGDVPHSLPSMSYLPPFYNIANVRTNKETLQSSAATAIAPTPNQTLASTSYYADVEDYLSENYIANKKALKQLYNEDNQPAQGEPKVMSEQSNPVNKCPEVRIKVRNLAELQ